jgi:hypothetical protein
MDELIQIRNNNDHCDLISSQKDNHKNNSNTSFNNTNTLINNTNTLYNTNTLINNTNTSINNTNTSINNTNTSINNTNTLIDNTNTPINNTNTSINNTNSSHNEVSSTVCGNNFEQNFYSTNDSNTKKKDSLSKVFQQIEHGSALERTARKRFTKKISSKT